ncbi:hypothetical protein PV327_006828 [Microctonus hyperodae]|uniref:Uncharacterized protein n=1 Tax=Microctonus hyperodae TaxID=165561 RepID=A0AA39KIR6_MICHY|nr:hypothetical protein PV327_006828 [Microctonus hyperodae]
MDASLWTSRELEISIKQHTRIRVLQSRWGHVLHRPNGPPRVFPPELDICHQRHSVENILRRVCRLLPTF